MKDFGRFDPGGPMHGRGLCNMHRQRVGKTGEAGGPEARGNGGRIDPDAIPYYVTVHEAIRADRGHASDYPCAGGCGRNGNQWAYDHEDAQECGSA